MGSAVGAFKAAAMRLGLSVAEYRERKSNGLKWCTGCKEWHPVDRFAIDRSRADQRRASCAATDRRRYRPRPRPSAGRRYVAARDQDRLQARRRVNHLVDVGVLPNPNSVACRDCGHLGVGPRHEYDHHLGYAAEHHEDVEPVCAPCHHRRELSRG